MSLISVVLLIAMLSFVPCCFSLGEFRCKAVPGCEIDARCDPSPFSLAHLDRNEFPINCVSNDAGKEKIYEDEVKSFKRKVKDLTSELKRVWDMNGFQNKDITRIEEKLEQSMKEISELEEKKGDLKEELAELKKIFENVSKTTDTELRERNKNLEEELTALKKKFEEMSETDITELQKKNENLEKKVEILEAKFEEISQKLVPGKISTTPTTSVEQLTTLTLKKKSCQDVDISEAKKTTESGGVFDVYPDTVGKKIKVFCDLTTDGGGWTVFQRRMDGSEDFYRGWDDYVKGFGEKDKEFWLGLENLHQLTKTGKFELRVDVGDFKGNTAYAKYGSFRIDSSAQNYKLHVLSYYGNAGDSLAYHNGMEFSTHDADHDATGSNCAHVNKGAWWYNKCHHSNLNSLYHDAVGDGHGSPGVIWRHWKNRREYLKFTEMKFRRK